MKTHVGKNIHDQRVKSGISQEQLAEMLDISRQSVSKWENGQAMPTNRNLVTLARIFECQITDLMENEKGSEENGILMLVGVYWDREDEKSIQDFLCELPFDVYSHYNVCIVILCGGRKEDAGKITEKLQYYSGEQVNYCQDFSLCQPNHLYWLNEEDVEGGASRFFSEFAEDYEKNFIGVILSESRAAIEGVECVRKNGGHIMARHYAHKIMAVDLQRPDTNNAIRHIIEPVAMGNYIAGYIRDVFFEKNRDISRLVMEKFLNRINISLQRETNYPLYDIRVEYILLALKEHLAERHMAYNTEFYNLYLEESHEERVELLKAIFRTIRSRRAPSSDLFKLREVFAEIAREDTIRILVMDCTRGLEAYVTAIMILEATAIFPKNIKIFAVDADEDNISAAMKGYYTDEEIEQLPWEWKGKYFQKEGEGWCVSRMINEMVLFSVHDSIFAPSFFQLDLVVCRNVMNTLRIRSRRRFLQNIASILKPNGIMILGRGQEIEEVTQLFYRYGQCKTVFRGMNLVPVQREFVNKSAHDIRDTVLKIFGEVIPSGVIINENHEIIYTGPDSSRYVAFRSGTFSRNLFDNINKEMGLCIRAMMRNLQNENLRNGKEASAESKSLGITDTFFVHVRLQNVQRRPFFLIWFEEKSDESAVNFDKEKQILENELRISKKALVSALGELDNMRRQYELMNEKFQSNQEELVLINDELQSSNKELTEMNKRLLKINSEYQQRNEQ